MALLDGFKVIPLKEKIEDSYLTITARSLKFNRSTAKVLGLPKAVHLLINEKRMQIAIAPTKEDDEDGVDFTFEEEGKEKPIYVKEQMILKEIKRLAVLERDGMNLSLTIKGTVYPDEKVIIYDLNEAEETVMKPRGRKKREQ
jgi:hypothetical protein